MRDPQFALHAQNEFRFLIDEFGFKQSVISPNRVRYSSDRVLIDVTYSDRHEIDIYVDKIFPFHEFQFGLFVQAYHPEVEKTFGDGIASKEEDVRGILSHFASVMRQYGKPLLEGDEDVFERMKHFKWWDPRT